MQLQLLCLPTHTPSHSVTQSLTHTPVYVLTPHTPHPRHTQAHPPFRIYARSKPMPIINSKHPRNPVWEHVSFPMSLELIPESNQVMIG